MRTKEKRSILSNKSLVGANNKFLKCSHFCNQYSNSITIIKQIKLNILSVKEWFFQNKNCSHSEVIVGRINFYIKSKLELLLII